MMKCIVHDGFVTDKEIVAVEYLNGWGHLCFRPVCKDCLDLPPDENDESEYCEFIMPEVYDNDDFAFTEAVNG
jgi:hypothetical protein